MADGRRASRRPSPMTAPGPISRICPECGDALFRRRRTFWVRGDRLGRFPIRLSRCGWWCWTSSASKANVDAAAKSVGLRGVEEAVWLMGELLWFPPSQGFVVPFELKVKRAVSHRLSYLMWNAPDRPQGRARPGTAPPPVPALRRVPGDSWAEKVGAQGS